MNKQIQIEAKRVGTVRDTYSNIQFKRRQHRNQTYSAQSEGFALGAVIAAEWIIGKQGVFTMKDVLELN
jgi:4-hydroxy-tetrahydrodipicolinate reductase